VIATRSRLVALSVVAAAGVVCGGAAATPVPLPSVLVLLTPVPPFASPGGAVETEGGAIRFPVDSDQRVTVAMDESGRPFSVRVRQRLVLRRAGDYSFVIGGPVEDVRAAPASESEPGLRRGAVLWAGFSPGRKVLAADVVLRASEARALLPLRVHVERAGDVLRVRLENATAVTVTTLDGAVRAADAAAALDALRRRGDGPRARPVVVELLGLPTSTRTRVAAPLHVRGEIRFPTRALRGASVRGGSLHGDAVRVDVVLGDESLLQHEVVVRGAEAVPNVSLVATPQSPVRSLEPPVGGSWREAARRRRLSAHTLLARAVTARLAAARARQYKTFLAGPDQLGPRTATYRYVTAARPPRATQPSTRRGDDGSAVTTLLAAALALAGAAALVVLWAHS